MLEVEFNHFVVLRLVSSASRAAARFVYIILFLVFIDIALRPRDLFKTYCSDIIYLLLCLF